MKDAALVDVIKRLATLAPNDPVLLLHAAASVVVHDLKAALRENYTVKR